MKLLEQFLTNKKRKYYHGSGKTGLTYISGKEYSPGIKCAFITTDELYAAKYAVDHEHQDSGYIYTVEFKTIPDIFDSHNPKDLKRWCDNNYFDEDWLQTIQETDWLFASELAFGKKRSEVIKCLYNLGYDGYSNYERNSPSEEKNHSICVFDPQNKLNILCAKKLDELYSIDKKIDVFFESLKSVYKCRNDLDNVVSDRIPNRWIDKKIVDLERSEKGVSNKRDIYLKERGYLPYYMK